MLELVRGNPGAAGRAADGDGRRLRLHGARGVGDPARGRDGLATITLNGALAVETFSRVASFASAFIPANLGALEASSLAAVAAVGARRRRGAGAGAPAARPVLGRPRPRDLPAHARRPRRSARPTRAAAAPRRRATLLYFPHDDGGHACRRRRGSQACRSPSACCARRVAPATRASSSGCRTATCNGRSRARGFARLARTIGGDVTRRDRTTPNGATRCAGARADDAGHGDRRRHGRVHRAAGGRARRSPGRGERRARRARGADWPESGVLRLTAGGRGIDPQRVAARARERRRDARCRCRRAWTSPTAARRLALRVTTPADLAEAEQTIRRSATRTPTPRSRGSTAGSRCRSASR